MKSMRSIFPAMTLLLLACMASPAWAVKPFVADYEATVKGTLRADAQMKLTRQAPIAGATSSASTARSHRSIKPPCSKTAMAHGARCPATTPPRC